MKRLSTSTILRFSSAAAAASATNATSYRCNSSGGAAASNSSGPSFVSGLFKRSFNTKEMFPYPKTRIDAAQRGRLDALLNSINSHVETTVASSSSSSSVAAIKGLRGISVPVDRAPEAGLGLSHTAIAAVMETLGEGQLLSDIYTALHTSTCAHLLSFFATGNQKDAYLPKIASGEATFGFAFAEMNIDVDFSMCSTTAADDGKGGFVLSGTKVLKGITTAAQANAFTHFVVLAKTATQSVDEAGNAVLATRSTLFVVKASDAGVKVDGSTVTFANTPTYDVVGSVGGGFTGMMVSKHTMRYGHDAAVIGTCKGLYNALADVGTPADVLNYVSALIYGMESSVYALTANMDNNAEDSLIDAAFASIAVHYCAERVLATADALANSSTTGLAPTVLAFRQQLGVLTTLCEPASSLQSIAACCGVEDFGIAFQKEGTLTTMGGRMARSLGSKQRLPLKVTWPEVAPIEDAFASFGDAVEAVFVKCGASLRYKQLTVGRIAKSGAFIYAACAAVSRAVKQDKKPTGASERALCKALLPILTAEAAQLALEMNNSTKVCDDAFVRVLGEMMVNYVPIDVNSPELLAEDKIIAEKKAAEEKAAAEREAAAETEAAEKKAAAAAAEKKTAEAS